MTAVVFDVGNVLIRWDPRLVLADHFADPALIDAFFEEIGFAEFNLEQDRGRSWAEGVAVAGAAHPHRRALIEKLDRDWHMAVPGAIEGSVDILERLRAAGVPLYAITNFSAEKWAECQERFAFLCRFRDVVVSAHERLVKPDPAIFELFLRRTRLAAGECVFIDDSRANIEVARAAGMDGILFEGPEALAEALAARGLPIWLFPLPEGSSWWVVQSRRTGRDGQFRIWELCWGADEGEVAANLAASDARLDETLMKHAIRRGDVIDEFDWKPYSTLVRHERMTRVETIEEVERCDPALAHMLREHEGFFHEFEVDGPGVIGGSVEHLPGQD